MQTPRVDSALVETPRDVYSGGKDRYPGSSPWSGQKLPFQSPSSAWNANLASKISGKGDLWMTAPEEGFGMKGAESLITYNPNVTAPPEDLMDISDDSIPPPAAPSLPAGTNIDSLFVEAVEDLVSQGKEGEAEGEGGLLSEFITMLHKEMDQVHTASVKKKKTPEMAETLKEEYYTFQVLSMLLTDVLQCESRRSKDEMLALTETIPQHRWWALSHKHLVLQRLAWDRNFRVCALVQAWAEDVYSHTCSTEGRREQYIAAGFWPHTDKLIQEGKGGSPCPVTGRTLISTLSLDAPRKERAYIHPADEETEQTLFSVLLEHVRCGDIASARRVCMEKQHYHRAATLVEIADTLQHIPEVHDVAPSTPLPSRALKLLKLTDGLEEVHINVHRYTYYAAMLGLCSEGISPGGVAERALYGALVGKVDAVLDGFGPSLTFRDYLWAHARCIVYHTIHETLFPFVRGHEECDTEDANRVITSTRPTCTSLSEAVEAAHSHMDEWGPMAKLQALLLRLLACKPYSSSADAFVELFDFLADSGVRVAPRLAVHTALQLWRCRHAVLLDIEDEECSERAAPLYNNTIRGYVQHLFNVTDPSRVPTLLPIVTFLSSKMTSGNVDLLAEFTVAYSRSCREEEADAFQSKLVERCGDIGIEASAVLEKAHELQNNRLQEMLSKWKVQGAQDDDPIGQQIEAVRLLTFIPCQGYHALEAFTGLCREIVNAQKDAEACAAAHLARAEAASAEESMEALAAADQSHKEAGAKLVGLQRLFDRTAAHLKQQFENRIEQIPNGGLEYSQLVVLRLEVAHWEAYLAAEMAVNQWRRCFDSQPVPPKDAVTLPAAHTSSLEHCMKTAQQHKYRKMFSEWKLEEAKCRKAFRTAAEAIVTRSSAWWLSDPDHVRETVDSTDLARLDGWLAARRPRLNALRGKVVPGMVENLLQMYSEHVSHISSPTERGEEYHSCMRVIDALVADHVVETDEHLTCFTNPQQAARVLRFIGRIEAAYEAFLSEMESMN